MTLGKLLETKRNEAKITRQYLSDLTQVPRDWIVLAEQELLEKDGEIIDRGENVINFKKCLAAFGINIHDLPKGKENEL